MVSVRDLEGHLVVRVVEVLVVRCSELLMDIDELLGPQVPQGESRHRARLNRPQ